VLVEALERQLRHTIERQLLCSKFHGYVQYAKVWAGAVSFLDWYVIGDVWGG
jgi:hypothetical protein